MGRADAIRRAVAVVMLWLAALAAQTVPADAAESDIVVLVARLDGDDGSGGRRLRDALDAQGGVVARTTESLPESDRLIDMAALQAGAARLEELDAELLLWGRVSDGGGLRLAALAHGDAVGMEASHGGVRVFALAGGPAFDASLAAFTLSMLEPVSAKQADALFRIALSASRDLTSSLADADALPANERAGLEHALGLSLGVLAVQRRDLAALEQAADHLTRAAGGFDREAARVVWASAQSDLGDALVLLGDQEQANKRLQQATAAYRAALEVWRPEATPLRWAGAQAGLASALTSLGARSGDDALFDAAITAYRATLPVLEELGTQRRWAQSQNRIGAILLRQGIRETGQARLEQAAEAFRAALAHQPRERAPLDWAMTQTNLGTALANLGERDGGTARLKEARTALTAAMQTFRDLGYDEHARRVRWNLRRVEAVLRERE